MADESGGHGSSIGWFLAGVGLGALVGVLYAPRSGSEVRDYIRERAGDVPDLLNQQSEQLKQSVSGWVDMSKDVVDRQKQQVQAAIDAAKQAFRETTADVKPPRGV